ncbi:hypothetical protein DSO57_1001060 [Entomophthora muscae]|uniref:Uncharacterized protein n=1 Tax=Entomophthora muscae TaxID=34485 RepID=A0ACC2RP19_9FUNG|nr:hypothetical protein DSO57_1001060 [Entomophthora muscae]
MKLITATLLSLVAGIHFIDQVIPNASPEDLITLFPFANVDGFVPKEGKIKIEVCKDGDCLLDAKPTKDVYVGLHLGTELATLLPTGGKLDYYITSIQGKHGYAGIHIIKTLDEGDSDFEANLDLLTVSSIFPDNARITLPYSDKPEFDSWLKKALEKFNRVIISIKAVPTFSAYVNSVLDGDQKTRIFFETTEDTAKAISAEVPGLKYLISTKFEPTKGETFSSTLDICEAESSTSS